MTDLLRACTLCNTDPLLEPGIARGNAGLWEHRESGIVLCLGHASVTRCGCGWPIISCMIAGCGTWKPVNDQVAFLADFIWSITHDDAGEEEV